MRGDRKEAQLFQLRRLHLIGWIVTGVRLQILCYRLRRSIGTIVAGLALDQDGLKGLDREAVERRGAVEQHRVALGDLLEDVPDLRRALLDHLAGPAHGVHEPELLQPPDDERLEKDERHRSEERRV